MADESPKDDLDKSEEATPKRREEARKRGQFAKSRSLIPVASLVAIAIALKIAGFELIERLGRCVTAFFNAAGSTKAFSRDDMMTLSFDAGLLLAPVLLPLFGAIVITTLGSGFLQTGFVMAAEPLRIDFSRISPIKGFRRLFGMDAIVESVKAVLLIAGLGCVGGIYIYNQLPALASLSTLAASDIVAFAIRDGVVLSAWIIAVMIALTAFDYLYQRWHLEKQLRMSRHEIKEEMREQEGDPLLKSHLKSLRQRLSRHRMISDVAKADVVITNPTHLAIALRYRPEEMGAPKVLAKGAGFIAEKIREVARAKGIAIVENKPLARLLYKQVEVGREIPEALYRAVAGVLAYVYGLRRVQGSPARTQG
jgi:flagellar biosynthetic protein FlhB